MLRSRAVDADTLTIIGTVLAVGLALAGLSLRTAARQDRRMDRFEDAMAAHRDRSEAAMAAHRDRFEAAMAAHRDRFEDAMAAHTGPRCTDSPNASRTSKAGSTNPGPPTTDPARPGRSRPPRPEPRQQSPHLLRIQGHPAACTTRRPLRSGRSGSLARIPPVDGAWVSQPSFQPCLRGASPFLRATSADTEYNPDWSNQSGCFSVWVTRERS